jgi:hypothetical protein
MIDFLQEFGNSQTTIGALAIAAFSSLIAAFGWISVRIADRVMALNDAYKERQAAIVKFYLDVCIRIKNCDEVFSDRNRDQYISLIQEFGKNFKSYVESTEDNSAAERMNEIIHRLKNREMLIVRSYIMYNDLLKRQYVKTGTDDFQDLTISRKASAIIALFETAKEVRRIGDLVVTELEKRKHIKAIADHMGSILDKPEADSASGKTEAEAVRAEAEEDQTQHSP